MCHANVGADLVLVGIHRDIGGDQAVDEGGVTKANKNPATVGAFARGGVSADGAARERDGGVAKIPAAAKRTAAYSRYSYRE